MDIGIVFVEDGVAKNIGDYLSTRFVFTVYKLLVVLICSYGVPDRDEQEDWRLEGSSRRGDEVELRFSRAIETNDKKKVSKKEGKR